MRKLLPSIHYKTNDEINRQNIIAIYFLFNDDELVYIGKTTNLKRRLIGQKSLDSSRGGKYFNQFRFIECKIDRLDYYERRWIQRFKPKNNRCLYDVRNREQGKEFKFTTEGTKLFIERVL